MILSSMDTSGSNQAQLFQIYRRFCDIRSRNEHANSREELAQFIKLVVSRDQTRSVFLGRFRHSILLGPSYTRFRLNGCKYALYPARISETSTQRIESRKTLLVSFLIERDLIVADLSKLMSHLNPIDSCQFQCFYDFVFVMCREKDQKNITVSRAIAIWRIVLVGRFRLLNHWCDFVEKHQRHNISEDTWQQVLAFSRCVHEDLGGYDQKGAWPVLIDDFVEHMFRITPSNTCSSRSLSCNCGDPEAQACISNDAFRGLKVSSGSKRKPQMYFGRREMNLSNSSSIDSSGAESVRNSKRSKQNVSTGQPGNATSATDGKMEKGKHGGGSFCTSNNSACAVEGSLSKGFAGLLSPGSCLQFDQKSRVSFT